MFASLTQALTLVQGIKIDDCDVVNDGILRFLKDPESGGRLTVKEYDLLVGERGPNCQRQVLLELVRRELAKGNGIFEEKVEIFTWKKTVEACFRGTRERFLKEELRVPAGLSYATAVGAALEYALEQALERNGHIRHVVIDDTPVRQKTIPEDRHRFQSTDKRRRQEKLRRDRAKAKRGRR